MGGKDGGKKNCIFEQLERDFWGFGRALFVLFCHFGGHVGAMLLLPGEISVEVICIINPVIFGS